jgi:hypothetical protein
MRGDLPWNGFIANDIETFVMKSVQLYQDERLWLQAQEMVVSKNQSSLCTNTICDFKKGRLNGCRIICSIVHLILWGQAAHEKRN